MAAIKSYTDRSQSKKLAEILPIESADMLFQLGEDKYADSIRVPLTKKHWEQITPDINPCWSLAALLGVLPNNEHIDTTISRGSWKIDTIEYLPDTWWCEYEDTKNQTEFNISADNPVDACVAMIEKLHGLNLL